MLLIRPGIGRKQGLKTGLHNIILQTSNVDNVLFACEVVLRRVHNNY